MRIAILGAGRMGAGLGGLWARLGHDVTFAYARDPDRLARRARAAGADAAPVAEAVGGAEAVLLAVHWSRVEDVLDQAGDLAGRVVLNCCVPLDATDSRIVTAPGTSGAEELAARRPGARWVSAFNTCPSESLAPVFARRDRAPRPQVLVCGDDAGARAVAHELARGIGYEPLDAGGLEAARFVEPFAMVTALLAYGQPGGPALTYRFDKLDGRTPS